MIFPKPLLKGTLIKRYKRFLADIELEEKGLITAHCPNSGALLGVTGKGNPVWVSYDPSPTRKLHYTWQLVDVSGAFIGVNTQNPNKIVNEALHQQKIKELAVYNKIKPEAKYGANSRIDFFLQEEGQPDCYVEVKNVHYKVGEHAVFPDSVTDRGVKHLKELISMKEKGIRAMMLYIIQRNDCGRLRFAHEIDPLYAKTAKEAYNAGVEFIGYSCNVMPQEITLNQTLDIDF